MTRRGARVKRRSIVAAQLGTSFPLKAAVQSLSKSSCQLRTTRAYNLVAMVHRPASNLTHRTNRHWRTRSLGIWQVSHHRRIIAGEFDMNVTTTEL